VSEAGGVLLRSTMSRIEVSPGVLKALQHIDSCTLSNAIELLNIRPRNEGFIRGSISCRFPKLPPVTGYAVTGTMRSASPPIGGRCYYEHIEWWNYVASVPEPRIIVMQDADDPPGLGALFGELHAKICRALNCVAYVTNGAVRDLPAVEGMGFQLFANNVSVSHAYAHVADFGRPVEIDGLRIQPGDLLHGDLHGIQLIPPGAAGQLPDLAAEILRDERAFIQVCLDGRFSIQRLVAAIREHAEAHRCK
jgi:4-hydroxy-4-methyl-2-oxoglutarate aldolase